jgi:hypothetical protein
MFDETGLTGDQKWFYHWIVEREKCRVGYESGGEIKKAWTDDIILQSYRFCNVRREHDVVSKWITTNWMEPYDRTVESERMLFAMCVARLFNRVSTLKMIGFPEIEQDIDQWLEHTRTIVKQAREKGEKIWTGAYLVSTNGQAMDKVDYILDKVLKPIAQKVRAPLENETLQSYHQHLMSFDGLGSFMAAQVIADLKFTSLLNKAPDWDGWAAIGPGSKRGLNRYFGRKLEGNIGAKQCIEELAMVQLQVQQRLGLDLAAHNLQNCACEFDKYMRVRNNEGKPRSTYSGKA